MIVRGNLCPVATNIARLHHLVGVDVTPHRVCVITDGLLDQSRDRGIHTGLGGSKSRNYCSSYNATAYIKVLEK